MPSSDARFRVTFANGRSAWAAKTSGAIRQSLQALGLTPRPVLALVGGASELGSGDRDRLAELMTALWRTVEKTGAALVDGGTNAGIMRLAGEARTAERGTAPLIGVAVEKLATWPGGPSDDERYDLEPNHSHFILVSGETWRDGVGPLAAVVTALADRQPSLTVLINGGSLTWEDARASVLAGRPLIVIGGSGRVADEIARGESRAADLMLSDLVEVADLDEGVSPIASLIEVHLTV